MADKRYTKSIVLFFMLLDSKDEKRYNIRMKNLIGERIRVRREVLKLPAAELAKRVGVTRAFVYMLEKGDSGVTSDRLRAFASALGVPVTDLDPNVSLEEPKDDDYLLFLSKAHSLDDDDRREIRKMVDKFGIPNRLPDESSSAFEDRWEAFYGQILQYLPNASLKILDHSEIRHACNTIGMQGPIESWRQIYDYFVKRLKGRLNNSLQSVTDGASWKALIANELNIIDTDGTRDEGWDGLTAVQIGAIAAQMKSSDRFYSAVVKEQDSDRYWYIKNGEKKLFDRRDASWWHEAVRVLLDPELKLKSGSVYYPDGEECPPLEQFFRRVSSWLAVYPFVRRFKEEVREFTPKNIERFIIDVFGDSLPWRSGFIGLIDSINKPLAYVDVYKRMKRNELKEAGLSMDNVVEVASHKKARLRIAFLARNFAAEEAKLELRTSLQIPETSSIYRVYASRSKDEQFSEEDFSLWDPRYDLRGKTKTCAYYQKGRGDIEHVRALIWGC